MIVVASYYYDPVEIRARLKRWAGAHELAIEKVSDNNEFNVLRCLLTKRNLNADDFIIFCNDTIFRTGRHYMFKRLFECEIAYRKALITKRILDVPVIWGSWFIPPRSPYFDSVLENHIRSDIFAFNTCYGIGLCRKLNETPADDVDVRDFFFTAYDYYLYNKSAAESLENYLARKIATQSIESRLVSMAKENNGLAVNVQSNFRSYLEKSLYKIRRFNN